MNRCTSASDPASAITFVLTSCGRFDLLEETLASFLNYNTAPISRYALIEDSGDTGVRDVVAKFDVPIEVIVNDPPLGQIASMDRLYATIDTPFVFHCEDDWRFFRHGFIEESMQLLRHDPSLSVVLCRRPGQNPLHDLIYECPPATLGELGYRKATRLLHPVWHGYSFNPGLRRLSDYKALGSFGRWGSEIDASRFFKKRGMTVAALEEPACETTGRERSLPRGKTKRGLRSLLLKRENRLRYSLARRLSRMGAVARHLLKR